MRYFVGVGCNLGDRLASLRSAIDELAESPGVELHGRSGIWETRPLGPGSGPFLNAAVEVISELAPEALLERLRAIEIRHGRIRRERWGDRTLDLDLLCAFTVDGREVVCDMPTLTLPHPGVGERDFVLQPLLDIDGQLRVGGVDCAERLAALTDDQRTLLRRVDQPAGREASPHAGRRPSTGGSSGREDNQDA
jgi:2-amino-4-hydroxy-6-hydroxymethyldihydropteridine diphosphokinase